MIADNLTGRLQGLIKNLEQIEAEFSLVREAAQRDAHFDLENTRIAAQKFSITAVGVARDAALLCARLDPAKVGRQEASASKRKPQLIDR